MRDRAHTKRQPIAPCASVRRRGERYGLHDRQSVARTIRAIFTATDVREANEKLKSAITHWQRVHRMLAKENLSEGFPVIGLPELHRMRMRSNYGLERLDKEIKRRTRVATLFPHSENCVRVSARCCPSRTSSG